MTPSFPLLVTCLSILGGDNLLDDDWSRAGLVNLSRMAAPSAEEMHEIPTWINRLGDEDFEVRERASHKLLRLGRAALPALRDGLAATDPEVRCRCAVCLGEMDNWESQMLQQLRCALRARVAYRQQIQALRESEKVCTKQNVLIQEAEGSSQQCQRDAERVERTLLQWGMSREELEKVKREAE